MATIGLDRLYYAKITENDAGEETYGTPSQLAKAISADLSVELAEATLYADDGASEIVKEFKSGTLSLGGGLPRQEIQRQVQVLLALPSEIRYSGDEPCHQGRQHYLLHADH